MQFDVLCMRLAVEKAWEFQGLTYPNPAVGCVVTYRDQIVAIEGHRKAGASHAEVLALVKAYEEISNSRVAFDIMDAKSAHAFLLDLPPSFFCECTLYVTLEPCSHESKTPSCALLIRRLMPRRVVVALSDPIEGHGGGLAILQDSGIEVKIGVGAREAQQLIEPFLIWQKRAFVLFKLAQTLNGKIGGGTLSSKESLRHVHQLREVCSRLLIGGNTVRLDRPRLDSRFTGGRAPEVAIYSKEEQFDESIPLFGIDGRGVSIGDDLSFLETPSFVLVEGGEGMMRALSKRIDWYLLYQTPRFSTHPLGYGLEQNLRFLHSERKGADLLMWSRAE